MQSTSPRNLSPTPPYPQRGSSVQVPPRSPLATSMSNFGQLGRRAASPSINHVPTNLNYTINRSPPTSLAPTNNKLDINLNINVNNDGTISTSTGQAPILNNTSQFINTSRQIPTVIHSTQIPPFVSGGSAVHSVPIGTAIGGPTRLPSGVQTFGRPPVGVGRPIGQPIGSPVTLPTSSQVNLGQPVVGQPFVGQPIVSQPIMGKPIIPQNLGQPLPNVGRPIVNAPMGIFVGQQPRPLGLPYGMLLPPQYVGYRTLDQKSQIRSPPAQIDTTIQQQRVYCVVCQQDYAVQDKQQHIKKHQRPHNEGDHKIRNMIKDLKDDEEILHTRPIVEPEEYNIQYVPNQYIMEEEILYSSPHYVPPPPPSPPVTVPATVPTPIVKTQIVPPTPAVQPETVRLTSNQQTISYVDPSMYQATRTLKEQATHPSIVTNPPAQPESRFTRNTFVSDQPSPAVQPSALYNRDTIQSQEEFRGSKLFSNNPNTTNTPMTPIVEEPHDSMIGSNVNNLSNQFDHQNDYGQASINNIPHRDTVTSEYARNTQVNPPPETKNTVYDSYNYATPNSDSHVAPRDSRRTYEPPQESFHNTSSYNEPEIPIEHIIGQKGGNIQSVPAPSNQINPPSINQPSVNFTPTQSITQPYHPQPEAPLQILQPTNQISNKITKLPKYIGGW